MRRCWVFVGIWGLAAALLGMSLLGQTASPVQASHLTVVTISGDVTLAPGFTLQLVAHASGPSAALSGQGSDSAFRGNPTGPPGGGPPGPGGYCRFPLAGSLVGNVVTLGGAVTFSNVPANLGAPVLITATDTGPGASDPIIFNFGPFVLVGTGSVVIAHQ